MDWKMIGHDWAVDLLQSHISRGQVRHAYLITGADGLGKRTLGLRFAQALFCTGARSPGEICGTCRACRGIRDLAFPDLHLVAAESQAGMIKVEQVRDLQGQLALKPFEGKWRVALCLGFHDANDSAANALLKTLEEPASSVVLILTARSAEALLPTIVSRCEIIPLRQVAESSIFNALRSPGAAEEQAKLIAHLADGRPGWALAAEANAEQLSRRTQWLDDMSGLLHESLAGRFAYLDTMLGDEDTESQRSLALEALEHWSSIWRDALLRGHKAQGVEPRNIDRVGDLDAILASVDVGTIGRIVRQAEEVRSAIQQNANVRLALENWFLDLPRG
jgi:DNA polymerase-3 subunit delta'